MSSPVTGINSNILRWARERAGCTIPEIASKMKKTPDEIERWESGLSAPTYPQLEKLAYQHYKRPLAIFFFPEPPLERDPKKEFRTLPEFEIESLSKETLFAIRQAEAMQLALRELNEGVNPSDRKIFREILVKSSSSAADLAVHVRDYLGIQVKDQSSWKNNEDALKHWRSFIQDSGIFVFKASLKQRDISGFCLVDPEFPLIYLNNSTAPARQSFTLFHELGHIFFGVSGITKQNDDFIEALKGSSKEIEVFANRFASEFLVPSKDFDARLRRPYDDKFIEELADIYKVSREAILRKLLDRNLVTQKHYESKSEEWTKQWLKSRKKGTGGDYYATQASYLGDKYLQLAFGKYYQGHYGIEQLADYIGVKVQNVPELEGFFLGKALK